MKKWHKHIEERNPVKSCLLNFFRGKCQERLAQGGDTSEDTRKITVGDPSKSVSASGVIIPLKNMMKLVSFYIRAYIYLYTHSTLSEVSFKPSPITH